MNTAPRIVSIGDMIVPGKYFLHSRFERVVNFEREGRILCVGNETLYRSPINLSLADIDFKETEHIVVRQSSVTLDSVTLDRDASVTYDSALSVPECDAKIFGRNLKFLEKEYLDKAPLKSLAFMLEEGRLVNFQHGFEHRLTSAILAGADLLFDGEIENGVEQLSGVGMGLTPSGDDFICGVIYGMHVHSLMSEGPACGLAQYIAGLARTDNMISNTMISMAGLARANECMNSLVSSLCGTDKKAILKQLARVLAQGETSGADMLAGFIITSAKTSDLCLQHN